MCGRYAQGRAIHELVSRYAHLGAVRIASEQAIWTGYNIAPGTTPAVLVRDTEGGVFGPMTWGFVPHWAKDLQQLKAKPINARSETAASSGMFRHSFEHRRCIVPALGFYEWQKSASPKQPFFIHAADQEMVSFAGLWSRWRDESQQRDLLTFTILTTSANEKIRDIHDRMPCILTPESEQAWLSLETTPDAAQALLRPYPAEQTASYPVSRAVNKVDQNGPELIEATS